MDDQVGGADRDGRGLTTPSDGDARLAAGESFRWAFAAFGRRWGDWVVATVAWYLVMALVIGVVAWTLENVAGLGTLDLADTGAGAALSRGVVRLVAVVLAALLVASFVRAALKVADGGQVGLGDLLDRSRLGPATVVALVFSLADLVAGAVPLVGWVVPVVVGYLGFFAYCFVVDRGMGPVASLRASVRLQTRDGVGSKLLVVLLAWVTVVVGVLLCGVGVLVGAPVSVLLTVHAFRRATGGHVAAV